MKTIMMITFFIVSMLLVVFGVHYFIYFSLVRFFSIKMNGVKLALILLFIFLPISFIVASVLTHFFHNSFVNWFYMISGLWLGLATTLLAFFAISWGVYGLASLIGWTVSLRVLGGVAIALAIIYSGYGIWVVYHPQVKEISVSIKNLPSEWQGKRVVQISDLHLGHVLGEDFFEKIISQINEQNVEAVFITGDMFDGMGDGFEYVARETNKIKAPKGVYFVTGNHENYFGLDKVYRILKNSQIKIFDNNMFEVDGLQILGINYPERLEKIDLGKTIKEMKGFEPEKPSILLYHEPVQVPAVKDAGVDLELCGHTHGGQIFPIGFIVKAIYRGFDRGLHLDGNFSIYTSVGTGTWGPTMRTGAKPEITIINLE